MHKSTHTRPAKRQRGATLIEALVSLLVLAVAVIGMLGVQVRTLMDTNTAASRTQAMLLIDDLSERIKANPDGYQALDNYVFNDTHTVGATDCMDSPCNPATLATYDVDQWLENFRATMPGAKVATFISSDNDPSTGDRQLGVLIGWMLRERNANRESDYTNEFIAPVDAVSDVECWDKYICHVVYIEP